MSAGGKLTGTAHVKEFRCEYEGIVAKPSFRMKWVKVILQVVVKDDRQGNAFAERLARHMDKPLPRFLELSESTPKPKKAKPTPARPRRKAR